MVKRTEYDNGLIVYTNDNGLSHREDGPAVIYSDGRVFWYKNGKLHREDGPAIIWEDGIVYWWLNGVEYSFNDWIENLNISGEEKMGLVLKYG